MFEEIPLKPLEFINYSNKFSRNGLKVPSLLAGQSLLFLFSRRFAVAASPAFKHR